MHGLNPIRPPDKGDGGTLDIQQIFPTLQGEGPYAGMPAIFIRLGGCNLACAFCDTEFESFQPMALADILERVRELSSIHCHSREGGNLGQDPRFRGGDNESEEDDGPKSSPAGIRLIVITGGEPLRQNIAPLCEALLAVGFKIQIETNGTLWRELPAAVEIVCSPKNSGQGYFPLRSDLLARVNVFKFIVSAQQPGYNIIPEVGQGDAPVFVQPMDEYDEEKNKANLKLAMQLAQRHNYRLSLQLHKLLGIE